jgi:hypothetical protein
MKLLNSSSLMGGLRRFVYYGMVEERERLFIDGMGEREIVY